MNHLHIRSLTSDRWSRRLHAAVATSLLALSVTASLAADPPVPSGVVALTASASVEVTRDLMSVTLSSTREGTDASTVQSALRQALDAALLEARGAAKPGQIDVRTGNFSMNPRYSPKGQLNGWQGTAELVLEGRDLTGIGQLAGRIQSMTIARVSQGLSREQREKAESGVTAQAIARYRAQAAEVTKQFGYGSYSVREVSVNSNEQGGPEPMMMRAKVFAAAADAPLPVEAGQTSVTVTVSGTVQMVK